MLRGERGQPPRGESGRKRARRGPGARVGLWPGAALTRPSICTCFTAESPEPPLPLPFPAAPPAEPEEGALEPVPSLRDAMFPARQEEREAWGPGSGMTNFVTSSAGLRGEVWKSRPSRATPPPGFLLPRSSNNCARASCVRVRSLQIMLTYNMQF